MQQIDRHLAMCKKQPGASIVPEDLGVGNYGDVLKRYDGVEGFIAPGQYLMLWSTEQIAELNASYQVSEFAPGIVLIGTDGGDTGYGRNTSTGQFGSIPLVGMSSKTFVELGKTFEEFLKRIANSSAI